MGYYDSIDADWTWDGDFVRGDDGDIGDTSYDTLKSVQNEIATIVKSELTDWELDPFIGTNLSDYSGEPNTRETGEAIEERVSLALESSTVVQSNDVAVRTVPINVHQVMIMITLFTGWNSTNQLSPAEPVSVNLVYDTIEKDIFFFPSRDSAF